jgi:hypothetical protein
LVRIIKITKSGNKYIKFKNSKMKKSLLTKSIIVSFILSLALTCSKEKNETDPVISNAEIEWIQPSPGEITSVYHYKNGVKSGQSFNQKFDVLNESGTVIINGQVKDDIKICSDTFNVEKGKQYKIVANVSFVSFVGSNSGATCNSIVLSSPNSKTKKEVKVPSYSDQLPSTLYYCPESILLESVSISPVN